MLSWVKNNRFVPRILIVKFIVAFSVLTLYPLEVDAGRVSVRGYYRKDGTYVSPHYRTAPDGNPYNNYSFPGNFNPNTGRITPGNPQTYLNRYYNRLSSSYSIPSYSTPSIDFDKWLKDWEADIDKQLKDLWSGSQTGSDVSVRGYVRKDETYVVPHVWTTPDRDPTNNYSYSGNYNPNTGKITTGESFNYLWRDGVHDSASSTNRSLTGKSFTIGSTKKEVINVQGTPDSYTDKMFRYGLSRVFFQDGRVTDWSNSTYDLLKVNHPAVDTTKTYFTIGSTKSEVARIQGTPDSYTDKMFRYGLSRVFFQDGRVTDWSNSTYDPLKVK